MRSLFRFVLLLALTLIFISASVGRGYDESGTGGNAITVVDYYGRITLMEGPAMRVVSLSPGITETIFALGYGERLIGRTEFCDYPEEVLGIEVVGDLVTPDVEAILVLNPDLVIASTHFPKEALESLISVGLKVVVFMGQESFQGVYDAVIRPVSRVLGDPEAGEALIREMDESFQVARERVEAFPFTPSVYYVVSFGEGGDWTAGGNTFIGEMITMAGGLNIAQNIFGWSYSLESLVDADPDIIIVPRWALDVFSQTPIYSELSASKAGRVYAIDESTIERQGPRIVRGFTVLVDIVASAF